VSCLLITRNLPPLVGGMERLNAHLWQALARRGPAWLCGPRGAAALVTPGRGTLEAPVRPLWRFLLATAWNALRLARRERPRTVIAGSGLVAPIAWASARLVGARCVAYLHGLDIVVDSAIYRALWLPLIRRCDLLLVNSSATAALARAAGIPAARIHVLHPGTELPASDRAGGAGARARSGLGAGPLLLSVGRLTKRKGLAEFVAGAFPRVLREHPEATLLVVGDEATDAAGRTGSGERARIEAAARAAGTLARVHFAGRVDEAELEHAYLAADVHVFPVLDLPGDVEGFGMVAIEAAARGLPTVAFASGGVVDAVASGRSGTLVVAGDQSALAQAVLDALAGRGAGDEASCRAWAAGFSWQCFEQRLEHLLDGDAAP